MSDQPPKAVRVIVLGAAGVGKTSLISCYFDGTPADGDTYVATIGIDYRRKTLKIDSVDVEFMIYDTAGQEKFQSLGPQYFKYAKLIFLVYALDNIASLNSDTGGAAFWLGKVQENSALEGVAVTLIGNKLDLVPNDTTAADNEVLQLKEKFKEVATIEHCKTSAVTGEGVAEAFRLGFTAFGELASKPRESVVTQDLTQSPPATGGRCC
jgi:small GTP-binding protein